MRTESTLYDDGRQPLDASDKRACRAAQIARRIGARILHEVREALPPTIFFFVGFNFVVLTSNLLVAQYLIGLSNFMLATVAALVVGKAVLVANKIVIETLRSGAADPTNSVQDRVFSTAPLSADLTDWRSRTAAEGLASRPIRSRSARGRQCAVNRRRRSSPRFRCFQRRARFGAPV